MAEKNPKNFVIGGPGCEVCRKVQDEAARKRIAELFKSISEARANVSDRNKHPNRK